MTSLRGLAADQRGAIMVVTVFMAAFLVGWLWFLIGIGDTILYKERMQDGADAVAFAGAVYHARGMNIIAMINIIMAGILAVLVAMKLVQVMNTIANIVSCALAWTGIGAAICSFTSGLQSPIQTAINTYENSVVKTTLPVLSKLQVGIAIGMPWAAQAKAVYVSMNYYSKPVDGGGIISTSLVPYPPRLGLPVQEDKYEVLCKRAGEFVGKVAFMPFGRFGDWVGGVIGGIVSSFPQYFCGGGGVMGFDFDASTVDMMCREKKKKKKEDDPKASFDMDECKKDTKKDLQRDSNKQFGGQGNSGGGGLDASAMTPKKVFDYAENGNSFFQVWSIVKGDDKHPTDDGKGVAIAAWNKGTPKPPPMWGKIGVAQAEFYYDAAGAWDKMKDDAMWNMKWRARMRRVRPPTGDVASLVGSMVFDKLLGKLEDKFLDAIAGADIVDYMLGQKGADKLKGTAEDLLKSGAKWADGQIQNRFLSDLTPPEIIH